MLSVAAFEKFLSSAGGTLRSVEIASQGEIFLNPELPGLLSAAAAAGVAVSADTGVNLNNASPEALEALVRFGVRRLRVSVDGATQEVYAAYRAGGDLAVVLENVRRINSLKRRYRSRYPKLKWQFLAFGHNEHELGAARQLALGLGMSFEVKLPREPSCSPVRDAAKFSKDSGLPYSSRKEFLLKYGFDYARATCYQLWLAPQLNWDGRILGCSWNHWGEFGGNALSDGLGALAASETLAYARKMLMGGVPPRPDIPCSSCALYRTLRETGRWITGWELHPARLALSRLAGNLLLGSGLVSQWDRRFY
ncbi:MAG: radical SAM protein [Elusimicrobia bacterium]|nr:radical SAM protein [Elusimicrobiota bacterium]